MHLTRLMLLGAAGVLFLGGSSLGACTSDGADILLPSEPSPADPTPEPPTDSTPLLLTEVMSDNDGSLQRPDGSTPDWIELYNPGPGSVELEGWGLSDDPDEPFSWTLPARQLLPGEFVLVYAEGEDAAPNGPELSAPFRVSAEGEELVLSRPDGSVAHAVSVPALPEDVSWGLAQAVVHQPQVGDGSDGQATFLPGPAGAQDPPRGWADPAVDDADWLAVTLPVGFTSADELEPLENLAIGRPTSQSSDGYGRTGAQAVDGDTGTFSHTGDSDLAPWWQVDLGSEHRIDTVRIVNRIGCCPERLYNIVVEVLDAENFVTWESEVLNPVPEGGTPTDPGPLLELDLTSGDSAPPVFGQHVRVSKQAVGGPGSTEWMSLAELEVIGRLAPPYASVIETDLAEAMAGQAATALLRLPLAAEGATPDRLTLDVGFDDAFTALLDGTEVAAGGAPDEAHDGSSIQRFTLDPRLLPVGGDGVLGLLGTNITVDDPDFLLRATLTAEQISTGEPAFFMSPTPGEPNGPGTLGFVARPEPSPDRGFFEAPFTLTLSSATPGATMAWTLDGSVPGPEHGTLVEPSDPQSPPTTTLDIETTAVLRAAAWLEGWEPSPVATHTFLFLDDVIEQPEAPAGFPTSWDGLAQSPIPGDYAMDPEVALDPAYTEDLLAGLRAIPTMSIVMPYEDLFGAEAGLYIHSQQRGRDWEREASVELILPDGETGFQVECGLRIHGFGWRPHANTKKHALRLEFRPEYGPSKLDYPLFPDAPVERFDSIVLRSQGSRSWQDFRDPAQAQYLRDAFARDTARDMGKIDGHATFVHLYLNGLYWGLYNPVERPDARFAAEYFGGEPDDYDAINRRTTTNEAIDGDLVAYETLLALADGPVETEAGYAAVLEYLDVDDLIDTMLIHQYTTNRDGPEQFNHNNQRGIRKREPGAGFRFFVWDMEYSLWGAEEVWNIDVDVPGSSSHVYARLRTNPEFRARYSDRATSYLFDGGALTPEACLERYEARAEEIEDAIVAESARWGDTDRAVPYTRDIEWEAERQRLLTQYFPARTDYLVQQLIAADLLVDPSD